ncbi:unnamed protein product [Prorocentrum cordatum]|uniref:Phytanoyl-CoA dioxygenase family protein n=1 Tax=Prorocentrum cordatum TaxID=2364126 RepID=A0ABN9PJD0_9DINO|nr:unnamed protein product [Polarella glacialis]
MPILGIPLFFEGESLRLSSPVGVSILGIGIRSRLATSCEGSWRPRLYCTASPREVAAANAAIDAHAADIRERRDPELRNARAGSALAGDGESGRRDLGGMLGWPPPHSDPFRSWLAHPRLVPYLNELCGEGYRMDHLPMVILQSKGSEGFKLHGGPVTSAGRFNPTLQYRCVGGQFFNSLLAMSVQLSPHAAGDGGFIVVRGSHKMNFGVPEAFMNGDDFQEHLYQPVTRPGDVVFFSEATVHGAQPWRAEHERRVALYRFAPATSCYGRTYSPQWPKEMLEGLTPSQRAVLEPPYAERLDRPVLVPGAEDPVVRSRNAKKRAFDKEVFGTDYF